MFWILVLTRYLGCRLQLNVKGAKELQNELEDVNKQVEYDLKKKDKELSIKVKEFTTKNGELYLKIGELNNNKEELE